MSEYATIDLYVNHVMSEIIKCDVELVSERLRALGWEKVVYCRNCKHHELQKVSYSEKPLSVCTAEWCEGSEHDNPLIEPDGFCAWGEKVEHETV